MLLIAFMCGLQVAGEMLAAFQAAAAPLLPPGAAWPQPVFTRVQLWGAALPLNTPASPCILDPDSRVGGWCKNSSGLNQGSERMWMTS